MKKYNYDEDRFFSVNEEEERLYSTGNDELDDLLEKAFCEGYEYAQKEFSAEMVAKKIANYIKKNPEARKYLESSEMAGKKAMVRGSQVLEKYMKEIGATTEDIAKLQRHIPNVVKEGTTNLKRAIDKGASHIYRSAARSGEEVASEIKKIKARDIRRDW